MEFTSDDTVTVTEPHGGHLSVSLPLGVGAAYFANPLTVYIGAQADQTANIGQEAVISNFQISNGGGILLNDDFSSDSVIDLNTWAIAAEDPSGVYLDNSSQTVTVVDTTPPVLTCASNKTVACGTAWTFDAPVATDNCSGTNVTLTFTTVTNGVCPQVFTRTWTATDLCGNTNSCSQTVTVVDTTPPVFTCANDKTVDCGSSWSFDPPTGVEACCGGNLAVTALNTVTNGSGCSTAITRTWQATDCCSNIATCTQTVTVVVSGPPITPVIVGLHYDAVGMHIIIQTQPCYTYALECKNSLTDPTWNICQTATGNGTNWEFIDPPPLPTARFYRVHLLCP
jgi:hypothetical protein